jgi:hypothetical protein
MIGAARERAQYRTLIERQIADTHRSRQPEPLITPTVIATKGDAWNPETQKIAASDAQRVLEALVAEYGVEAAVTALDHQGFRGSAIRYLLTPLYDEAFARRLRKNTTTASSPEDDWFRRSRKGTNRTSCSETMSPRDGDERRDPGRWSGGCAP